MSTTDRALLAAFLAGNITEAHKAASPAHLRQPDALQCWHDAASEDERTRSRWASTVIAAADTRNRQRAVASAGNADYAEKLRTQADNLDDMASKQLTNAISAGAFDNWPMPASV